MSENALTPGSGRAGLGNQGLGNHAPPGWHCLKLINYEIRWSTYQTKYNLTWRLTPLLFPKSCTLLLCGSDLWLSYAFLRTNRVGPLLPTRDIPPSFIWTKMRMLSKQASPVAELDFIFPSFPVLAQFEKRGLSFQLTKMVSLDRGWIVLYLTGIWEFLAAPICHEN